jgi:hypothetical protein
MSVFVPARTTPGQSEQLRFDRFSLAGNPVRRGFGLDFSWPRFRLLILMMGGFLTRYSLAGRFDLKLG